MNTNESMDAVELTGPQLDALRITTLPVPEPGRGDVLVRMRAASLNFLDIAVARGEIPIPSFPIVPVTDGAGNVASLGEDVTDWIVGDRVIPHFMPDWQAGKMTPAVIARRRGLTLPGSLSQFVAVPAASLVRIPNDVSFEAAATLPIAATTAWRAVRAARLGPGMTALVLGTGGVSIFALQFAKAHGARVIVTSSSDEKLSRARDLGADLTINYRSTPAWDVEALRLTDGLGADLILETGGATTFPQSINAAAMNGVVFVIGFLSGVETELSVIPVIEKGVHIQGNNAGPVADLRAAVAAIGAHRIAPILDRTFVMQDSRAAYAHVAAGGHFGKVAIDIP